MVNTTDYAVQMKNITKKFGVFTALDEVQLNVKKGTIHAILGENGAGKSTLMNILYGLYQATAGEIIINNKKVEMKTPSTAIEHNIGMVHQHFMLIDNFTVTQNIVLGTEPTKKMGIVDFQEAKKKVIDIIEVYGLKVSPDAYIEDISVGMQQRVEILKALYRGAEILILDEPTAVLTTLEIEELIVVMKKLIAKGKTILIITHKLKEIKKSADECTIIRRGKYIDTVSVKKTTESQLAEMMIGRNIDLKIKTTPFNPGKIILDVNDLIVKDERGIEVLKKLNLAVRSGEIVGIAGVDGNGQKELIEAITNLIRSESGTIKVNKQKIENTTPKTTLESGISIIHEDRHKRGLILDFTVEENVILEKFKQYPFSKKGFIDRKVAKKTTKQLIDSYDVRPKKSENLLIRELSGGNQQKIIIGREINNASDVLIAVQPTRGLDVGAIGYVHQTIIEERNKGKAVLLISFEIEEVLELSDTIAVIYDGQIASVFSKGGKNEQEIGLLMTGGEKDE